MTWRPTWAPQGDRRVGEESRKIHPYQDLANLVLVRGTNSQILAQHTGALCQLV